MTISPLKGMKKILKATFIRCASERASKESEGSHRYQCLAFHTFHAAVVLLLFIPSPKTASAFICSGWIKIRRLGPRQAGLRVYGYTKSTPSDAHPSQPIRRADNITIAQTLKDFLEITPNSGGSALCDGVSGYC